jgi:hypothetical protein
MDASMSFSREYARQALERDLKYEAQLGVNAFEFGVAGSTDAHTSLSITAEDSFFCKVVPLEPSADPDRFHEVVAGRFSGEEPKSKSCAWQTSASGLAAVWAPDNTRDAPWDTMMRKEV